MTPEHFADQWPKDAEPLENYSDSELRKFRLNIATINFLAKAGLPKSCAPFLSFAGSKNISNSGNSITTLSDIYQLDKKFEAYVVIGSDGAGNPIAINTNKDCLVQRLDHENNFSEEFMNSSIHSLAHSLLLYTNFILSILVTHGENAYLDCVFNDDEYNTLTRNFRAADEQALSEGFWKEELNRLLIDREFYKTQ